jgi:plastocyanin
MDIEVPTGPPRGLLLGLGVIGLLVGGAIAGEFVLRLQPGLGGGTAAAGSVLMPVGVGSDTSLNFNPVTITVIIGQNNTVTFTNKDTAIHTVTADDGSFDSGNIQAGASWTYTFNTPGTFPYHCIYHSWMKGTVVVLSSAPGSTSTPSQSTNSTTTTNATSTISINGTSVTVDIPSGTGSNESLDYTPSSITLVVGINNTVTFVNQDSVTHSVTANDGSFNSGDIIPGQTWTHTFAAGTYSYHCIYHDWMHGNITVLAS